MKRLFFLIAIILLLIGCNNNEVHNDSNKENEDESRLKTELNKAGVNMYLIQITGKHMILDSYDDGSLEQQKQVDKAITDVNLAVMELEEDYEPGIKEVEDLLELADSVRDLLDDITNGIYNTKYDNSVIVGQHIGEISRNYLDGELPAHIQAVTGLESAN